jgi:DtxR family Mn-dependent transcriptional regulator
MADRMTAALEDYLKTIYLLHRADRSVRLIDIAEMMSVSKPSAFNAVTRLAEAGLIEHMHFGPVLLTEQGIEAAQNLSVKFDTIKTFLMRTLNIEEPLACSEACAIEHTIRDATLVQMAALMRGNRN